MNRNKILGLLGLAEKAGKVRSGEFSTEKAVSPEKPAGDRVGRIFGQHEENVPEHVYLL